MALIKPNERLNQAIRQKKFSQILNFSFRSRRQLKLWMLGYSSQYHKKKLTLQLFDCKMVASTKVKVTSPNKIQFCTLRLARTFDVNLTYKIFNMNAFAGIGNCYFYRISILENIEKPTRFLTYIKCHSTCIVDI